MEAGIQFANSIKSIRKEVKFDKYLRICKWAKRRYTVNGKLDLYISQEPTKYTKIEFAAYRKYLS